PPPAPALGRARALLAMLGALDGAGDPTPIGRRMLAMPLPPRLARMMVEAEDAGVAADGALLAALASERDVVRATRIFGGGIEWPAAPADPLSRLSPSPAARRAGFAGAACEPLGPDARAVRAVEHTRRQLARRAGASAHADPATLQRCLLAGFPDRVCRRRA